MTEPKPLHEAESQLRAHGIRPRHGLGQNFLDDPATLEQIVGTAKLGRSDTVLEIGCGLGSLTRYLAGAAGGVIAVEVDPRLSSIARENLRQFSNVRIIDSDFLDLDLSELRLPPGFVVAANIPYNITSLILRRLLGAEIRPSRIVLTVQLEVAERICATPPDMSLLAVSVQVFGRPTMVQRLPAGAFFPKPDVDSAVVLIDCSGDPLLEPRGRESFFRLVRAGFSQPRKMLRNTIASGFHMSRSQAEGLLAGAGIDPSRRAETLSVSEWIRLHDLQR